MKAIFLDHLPLSGEYPERSYRPTLECDWVLFESEPAGAWVGAFGRGCFGCRQALRFGSTSFFLVLASGEPYVVNGETGDQVSVPTGLDIMTAVQVPDRDLIVAADYLSLFAFSSRGLEWESATVAIEGIDLLEVTSTGLRGHLHTEDGPETFALRFQDWQLRHGHDPPGHEKGQS